jgi:hypothetical protein
MDLVAYLLHVKAFQPSREYHGFFYRGFTIEDFAKRDPVPQKRPPQRFLGCLELQFGNSARLEQSYHTNKIVFRGPTPIAVAKILQDGDGVALCEIIDSK